MKARPADGGGPAALAKALLEPGSYPANERPTTVELVETHVSWLFLTGRFAYKVKKPVDYGFLDFTTLERRRFYCEEEVRLNRRLSPDVYLGVVPIGLHDGQFRVGASGAVSEYAVKMRQLPRDAWLSTLLDRGDASPALMRRIAQRVAAFHAAAETNDHIRDVGGLAGVRVNTAENFAQTREYVGITLSPGVRDQVQAYTEAFIAARADVFAQREAEGRIRDCHGDLHADQICVEDGLAFIDCIEFAERFRFGDVAADIAFPAMDVEYHGQPDLARELVQAYVEASGDRGVREVLDFYRCYRAFTRGKVRSFRLRQPGLGADERAAITEQAKRYFDLAARYAAPHGPLLLVVMGLMGTGKTTLAQALAPRLDAELMSSDVVRKTLVGLRPDDPQHTAWGEGIYSADFHQRTYDELHRRAGDRLRAGGRVILDASYRNAKWRQAARDTARQANAPFLLLELVCPESVVRERLTHRVGGPSDGRAALLDAQRAQYDPVRDIPADEHDVVDAGVAAPLVAAAALRRAYLRLLTPAESRD